MLHFRTYFGFWWNKTLHTHLTHFFLVQIFWPYLRGSCVSLVITRAFETCLPRDATIGLKFWQLCPPFWIVPPLGGPDMWVKILAPGGRGSLSLSNILTMDWRLGQCSVLQFSFFGGAFLSYLLSYLHTHLLWFCLVLHLDMFV